MLHGFFAEDRLFCKKGARTMKKRKKEQKTGEAWWPGHAQTDPQGSWTGKPDDPMEKPVQDADDL